MVCDAPVVLDEEGKVIRVKVRGCRLEEAAGGWKSQQEAGVAGPIGWRSPG